MINDFNEIENEIDREAYVMIRQLIDRIFLESVQSHKQENHSYGACFQDLLEEIKYTTIEKLKEYPTSYQAIALEEWIAHNVDRLLSHLTILIILSTMHDDKQVKH